MNDPQAFTEVMKNLHALPAMPSNDGATAGLRRIVATDLDWYRGTERLRGRRPFYPSLLRLRHIRLRGWQRAVLGEGMAVVGVLLSMADLASAWSILVLPVAVAGVVKAHDLLAGLLAGPPTTMVTWGEHAYLLTDSQVEQLAPLRTPRAPLPEETAL